MKITRLKKVDGKRIQFLDDMNPVELLEYEENQTIIKKENIHKKIIDKYTITDQLNTIRRVLLEMSNDTKLKQMTDFIEPLLKEKE